MANFNESHLKGFDATQSVIPIRFGNLYVSTMGQREVEFEKDDVSSTDCIHVSFRNVVIPYDINSSVDILPLDLGHSV